jgi:uncharacterized membrane protein
MTKIINYQKLISFNYFMMGFFFAAGIFSDWFFTCWLGLVLVIIGQMVTITKKDRQTKDLIRKQWKKAEKIAKERSACCKKPPNCS